MTRFDGDMSPAFEIVEPAEWRAPVIFNSPHSGSTYPDEFLLASRDRVLRKCAGRGQTGNEHEERHTLHWIDLRDDRFQ